MLDLHPCCIQKPWLCSRLLFFDYGQTQRMAPEYSVTCSVNANCAAGTNHKVRIDLFGRSTLTWHLIIKSLRPAPVRLHGTTESARCPNESAIWSRKSLPKICALPL